MLSPSWATSPSGSAARLSRPPPTRCRPAPPHAGCRRGQTQSARSIRSTLAGSAASKPPLAPQVATRRSPTTTSGPSVERSRSVPRSARRRTPPQLAHDGSGEQCHAATSRGETLPGRRADVTVTRLVVRHREPGVDLAAEQSRPGHLRSSTRASSDIGQVAPRRRSRLSTVADLRAVLGADDLLRPRPMSCRTATPRRCRRAATHPVASLTVRGHCGRLRTVVPRTAERPAITRPVDDRARPGPRRTTNTPVATSASTTADDQDSDSSAHR